MSACKHADNPSQKAIMLFPSGKYPHATFYQDRYYYTSQPEADTIYLSESSRLEDLNQVPRQAVWWPDSGQHFYHLWSPELHRIQGKWYIYFEADDGNMDNHHLYVLENGSDNPMQGKWCMKGVLQTNDEWNYGLHPTILQAESGLYLLWSGWPKRRTEIETQCIYIAKLSDPWTVGTERVLLSKPEYEWELQWINPNGNRLAYPIYVNENPEAFLTPDGRHVCVCYSASGIWTIYHVLGMLTAPSGADLLDPTVWSKSSEPLFTVLPPSESAAEDNLSGSNADSSIYSRTGTETDFPLFCGTSIICLVTDASTSRLITSSDGLQTPFLYEGKWFENQKEQRSIFLGTVSWGTDGLPVFGHPVPIK